MTIDIIFKEDKFILVGNLEDGGAIAKREDYENFEMSYAHLFQNGEVKRFGVVIGSRADILQLNAEGGWPLPKI